jgi:WD40 repeat protein
MEKSKNTKTSQRQNLSPTIKEAD